MGILRIVIPEPKQMTFASSFGGILYVMSQTNYSASVYISSEAKRSTNARRQTTLQQCDHEKGELSQGKLSPGKALKPR
jgi:hypothetical protein